MTKTLTNPVTSDCDRSMTSIAFIDFSCPNPYDATTVQTQPLGGTEASVVRIAEALATNGHSVTVVQHNRTDDVQSDTGVAYRSPEILESRLDRYFEPKNLVVLRDSRLLALNMRFPKAKTFLWLHDLQTPPYPLVQNLPLLQDVKPTIVAVSRYHRSHVLDALASSPHDPQYDLTYVYNPVDDALKPDQTPVDPNKFIFMSSPHKGLDRIVQSFKGIHYNFPEARLHVANPGYFKSRTNLPDYVVPLGELPHPKVIQHMREAFCLFYPNPDYFSRETYGLVAAECNAVGTPVLCAELGGLPEVLGRDMRQFVNPRDPRAILERIEAWRGSERPQVGLQIPTRTPQVVKEWESLFA